MNVQLILVFIIYVLIPNGLYSQRRYLSTEQKAYYRDKIIESWREMREDLTPFREDDKGNIFVKLWIKPGVYKVGIFLESLERIGIRIRKKNPLRFNEEVIDYLSEILGINTTAMSIFSGCGVKTKVVEVKTGHITLPSLKKKLLMEITSRPLFIEKMRPTAKRRIV